jgi:D-3-phosphoglycerate dehydrogenase / 2-oxoglutarate reductase
MITAINFDREFAAGSALLHQEGIQVIDCFNKKEIQAALTAVPQVLVVRLGVTLDSKLLTQFPELKNIASVTTGLDHIDLEYCARNSIDVVSLQGETEFLKSIHATAEHTVCLMLCLYRNVVAAATSVKNGEWNREKFFGMELAGKTIGIVGYGRLGQSVARIVIGFGANIVAVEVDQKIKDANSEVTFLSLRRLAEEADIITLHVPLTKSTDKLISADLLSCMKESVVIVNTSRGKVIDEVALLDALESGRIRGAAVDVLADEIMGIDSTNPLIRYSQANSDLLITPHIGGSTAESMRSTARYIAQRLADKISEQAHRGSIR